MDAVRTALDGATTAHLAAHGTFRPGNALFSSIRLVGKLCEPNFSSRLNERLSESAPGRSEPRSVGRTVEFACRSMPAVSSVQRFMYVELT